MVIPCTLQVVLTLWVMFQTSQMTPATDNPPVVDGKSLVLTCRGHSESTQRRSLYWMTTDIDGDSVNQATCHSTEPGCQNYHDNFVATASFTGKDYTTLLTISAISNRAWFVTVNCILYETERDISYVIESWTMSDFVHPPENPVCASVYNVEEATVTVSCSTTKVSPAILCKFFEVHDNGKVVPLTVEIKYSYTESNTAAYQCSLIKPISKPGIYKYKVDLYPGLTDSDLLKEAATTVYTNEISVAGKPEVHIKSIPGCRHNKRQRFVCTSHWLPSRANLVWFKNTTIISNTTTTITYVGSGFYASESSVELENLHSYNGPIYCLANYMVNDRVGNKTISAQLLVDTNVPSLHFTYKGIPLGNKLVLEKEDTPGKFECRVDNGKKPPINAVEVVCKISDKVQNFTLVAESVVFDLPPVTSGNVGICYCWVTINSGCNKPKVNFTFSLGHAEYSRSTFPRQGLGSYINNIYYITAGCVGLMLLVFFLGTVMFLVRKWDKLYTYVYGKLYASAGGQSTSVNGGHWYYSVASSVQTRLPCEETSLETDSVTASPSSFHSHIYSNVDVDSDEEVILCADPSAFYPPLAETIEYSNLINGVIYNPAATHTVIVSEDVPGKPIKCNGLFQQSDLAGNLLHKYNRQLPPKPCKLRNCPDLLLHRPSLPQLSSSDDEQSYHTVQEIVTGEEYVAVF